MTPFLETELCKNCGQQKAIKLFFRGEQKFVQCFYCREKLRIKQKAKRQLQRSRLPPKQRDETRLQRMEAEIFLCNEEPKNDIIFKEWAKKCRPRYKENYWNRIQHDTNEFHALIEQGPDMTIWEGIKLPHPPKRNAKNRIMDENSEANQRMFGNQSIEPHYE